MKCSNCDKEYSDINQVICEYCGSELIKIKPIQNKNSTSKIEQIIEDTRIKDLYQKIKRSIIEKLNGTF